MAETAQLRYCDDGKTLERLLKIRKENIHE